MLHCRPALFNQGNLTRYSATTQDHETCRVAPQKRVIKLQHVPCMTLYHPLKKIIAWNLVEEALLQNVLDHSGHFAFNSSQICRSLPSVCGVLNCAFFDPRGANFRSRTIEFNPKCRQSLS